jgi:hypothetical protein
MRATFAELTTKLTTYCPDSIGHLRTVPQQGSLKARHTWTILYDCERHVLVFYTCHPGSIPSRAAPEFNGLCPSWR